MGSEPACRPASSNRGEQAGVSPQPYRGAERVNFNKKKFLTLEYLLSRLEAPTSGCRREDQYESTLPQKTADKDEL